jgi:ABC-type glutathione transport system ATPase component
VDLSGENMEPLLRVENLMKQYADNRPLGERREVTALAGVSLSIYGGKITALVGESGSGKSTLALCLACLERPSSGSIWFEGRDITALGEDEQRRVRPKLQLVFQDPAGSLNPRLTALEIVSEPLIIQKRFQTQERFERAWALLERVGIPGEKAGQRPDEFSGGQRQRLAIARALALEPKLLILDEALAALDCSVQAQIANLLLELQSSLGLTCLFITHDFAMAAHLADEIGVMDHGRIVELGAAEKILRAPENKATLSQLAATPRFRRIANPLAVL